MSSDSKPQSAPARWARPLALSLWLSAAVLAAFGGVITTLRAGMAIDGWWVLDRGQGDYFLLAYPIDRWFKNSGTFSEHTHRLFGVLVGLLSIAYVVARTLERPRSSAKLKLAWAGLLAVCAQGALGGFRVLENSPELAFVHGAFAQLVFALLGVNVVLSARSWDEPLASSSNGAALRRTAWLAAAAVYVQIVLGAWLRHSGADVAVMLHIIVAALATGAVLALCRALRRSSEEHPVFGGLRKRLLFVLMAQLTLGVATLLSIFIVSGGFTAEVSTLEVITATAHVLLGALLLQQTVAAAIWAGRRSEAPAPAPAESTWRLEGAR